MPYSYSFAIIGSETHPLSILSSLVILYPATSPLILPYCFMLCFFNSQSSSPAPTVTAARICKQLVVTFPFTAHRVLFPASLSSGLLLRLTLPQAFDLCLASLGRACNLSSEQLYAPPPPCLPLPPILSLLGKTSCISEFLLRYFPYHIHLLFTSCVLQNIPPSSQSCYIFLLFLYSEKSFLKSSDFKCSQA